MDALTAKAAAATFGLSGTAHLALGIRILAQRRILETLCTSHDALQPFPFPSPLYGEAVDFLPLARREAPVNGSQPDKAVSYPLGSLQHRTYAQQRKKTGQNHKTTKALYMYRGPCDAGAFTVK